MFSTLRSCLLSLLSALGVLALAGHVSAQTSFKSKSFASPDPKFLNEFGFRLSVADVNGDSFADVVASEPEATIDGLIHAGRAWVFYGPTFIDVLELRPDVPTQFEEFGYGGFSIADATDDGVVDILVLSPEADEAGLANSGTAHLFLGPDFRQNVELMQATPMAGFRFGWAGVVLGVDCADRDVLVGAPFATLSLGQNDIFWAGEVQGFDLPGLLPVSLIETPAQDFGYFGRQLITSDIDEDGQIDVIIAAPSVSSPGSGFGEVYVMDACGQSVSQTITPPVASDPNPSFFGASIACGNLTGTKAPDLLIGAPTTDPSGIDAAGVFFLLEGPSFGSISKTFVSPVASVNGTFGYWSAVGDFTHDGVLDIALGDPYAKPLFNLSARVYVYPGPDFTSEVIVADPSGSTVEFGEGVTAADVDGDGYDELICRSALADASGIVHVFDPVNLTPSVSSLSVSQGGTVSLHLGLGPKHAGKDYLLVLGISGSDPGVIAAPGSYVRLNVDVVTWAGLSLLGTGLLENFVGTLDAQGGAQATLNWPAGFAKPLAGKSLTVAAVAIDGGSPSAGSSAASISLTP